METKRGQPLTLKTLQLRKGDEQTGFGDGIHFLFPTQGSAVYKANGSSLALGAGDILIFGDASRCRLTVPEDIGFSARCFVVLMENLLLLASTAEIGVLMRKTDLLKQPRLYPASLPLAVECHQQLSGVTEFFGLDHRTQLLRIAGMLLSSELQRLGGERSQGAPCQKDDRLNQIFESLTLHDILLGSVDELAARFGCTRRHLNRLFNLHLGVSAAALKMEMRLVRAAALLRSPDVKIIHVAEQCGFNHPGLFNACFKRRFGVSPGVWRKERENEPEAPPSQANGTETCWMQHRGLCPWPGKKA